VGVTLAVELLERPLSPMPPAAPFPGAGVYALYYTGSHAAYADLVALNRESARYPVYIGKASSWSTKQGFSAQMSNKRKLYERITHHAQSIDQADNLDLADFQCRYIVLNDAYITLAESVMIRVFRPPWNGMSFGSKVVGVNRIVANPPLWDSLHPGRGGRPPGTEARGIEAAELIGRRVAELENEISDPITRRMFDRINKFV
jgi:hypothetical protein